MKVMSEQLGHRSLAITADRGSPRSRTPGLVGRRGCHGLVVLLMPARGRGSRVRSAAARRGPPGRLVRMINYAAEKSSMRTLVSP